MGIVANEKNFPRGGKKPAVAVPKKGSFGLLHKTSQKTTQLKLKKKDKEHASSTQLKVARTEPLTLKTLTEGMLVLGCVREIQEYEISVSLPGRLIGCVPITNISAPYTKCLKALVDGVPVEEKIPQLDEIFHIGQALVTRVTEINHSSNNKNTKVMLSLVPDVVQSDWSPRTVTTGSILIAAVKSQEENGYIMDTGIKNVRAFLKKSAALNYEKIWNHERSLGIGHLVRCLVTKSNVMSSTATVELSADPNKVTKAAADCSEITIDTLLPGTLLEASVSKVLQNGLEMKFGERFVGYVHKDHLSALWDTPQDYSEGDEHFVRVLYVLPTVKFIYLSMQKDFCDFETNSAPNRSLKTGDVVKKAKIVRVEGHGVTIRIKAGTDKNLKGFVPINHCPIHDSKSEGSESLADELQKKLAVDTEHKCRVLDYDHMSQMFICTLDKHLIKARFLGPGDLQPGMKISCIIREHVQSGAFVTTNEAGKSLTAFVRSFHLGNVPLQHPEKKFPVGSQHTAQVLLVQGNKIQLTLKPVLMDSAIPPLHRIEDAKRGMGCEGVVTMVKKTGLLLTFYGDVKGWLGLTKDERKEEFFVGQVLSCSVKAVDIANGKLMLSFKQRTTSDGKPKKKCRVGNVYQVTITNCTEVALEVKSNIGNGIIPSQHLTDSPSLAQLLLSTYAAGDTIDAAFCFSEKPLIFTLRPSLIKYFECEGAGNWATFCEQLLLPCVVRRVAPTHVTLQLPLSKCTTTDVKLKDLFNFDVEDATRLGLAEHQGLMARVLKIVGPHKSAYVTTKLSHCWDYNIESSVSLLCAYWQDYNQILEHMKEQGNPLASLVPGDRVKGVVVAVKECGAVVKLDNGIQGIATPKLFEEPLKCGEKVEGTVLFIDFQNNHVELTLHPAIMKRINTTQDGELDGNLGVGTGVRAEVLTVHQEMVVVVLKGAGRQQLAYVPSRLHTNDLMPDLRRYRIGETSKMIVKALVGGRIICVQQRVVFELIKLKAKAMVTAGQKKKDDSSTLQDLDNSYSGVQDIDMSYQEDAEGNSPTVKRRKLEGHNSCDVGTKEFHMEKTVEDVDSRGSQKKRKLTAETKTHEQVARLSLSTGFVCEDNPSLLPVVTSHHKSDTSSDEEEQADKEHHMEKTVEDVASEGSQKKRKLTVETKNPGLGAQLSLSAGFVCEDNPSPLPAATTHHKSDTSSDEEEQADTEHHMEKTVEDVDSEGSQKKRKLTAETKNPRQGARLSLSAGFVWEDNPSLLPAATAHLKSDTSSDEEEQADKNEGKQKKLSRAERRKLARQEEKQLREVEQKLMDSEAAPQSADDFDRLVLSSPNSSLCWIKYMAFHLQATEIEKARAIAQRALSTISFREEQEKLNVWCALLNLENLYGTKESLDTVLEEAVRMNDPFRVYTQMLQIYAESGKTEEAERLVSLVTKKFRDNKEAWMQGGEVLLKLGKLEKARSLMQKALASLEKKLHVEIISKFAQLENRLGEPERAQTLMEHILTSYPKRVDIWSSYVDMLVKNGQLEIARQVLERGVAQKLPARKMKSLFAKFLQFESHHGTPESVEKVRGLAVSYVEATSGQADDNNE